MADVSAHCPRPTPTESPSPHHTPECLRRYLILNSRKRRCPEAKSFPKSQPGRDRAQLRTQEAGSQGLHPCLLMFKTSTDVPVSLS